MQQTIQQPERTWKAIVGDSLKESTWITASWEWLQKLLGRAVDAVLWTTMIFAGYQLIPGAPPAPQTVSIAMFVLQFIALGRSQSADNRAALRIILEEKGLIKGKGEE